ncbi:hypothetical protein SAMN05444392_10928 [Seinonella peptonophila]|uniref:Probable membrane transporter protein n=1 Tax=Seinonella peptonophila TaxID=112248 RepID=A0A1M4ZFU1_9BACL|nr:sulfite exporter TauE/SafE family protein [Seinonella peptonophila]SHF16818.1 hypothetical protein SAMN05444392_10928 [Seinonella peptonophila]
MIHDLIWIALLWLIVGWIAGTFGSLVGLGGGVIIVPMLLFSATIHPQFAHITPAIAVGTSMLLIILTACSSSLSYAKQGKIDFTVGWLFFIACGPGALIGAYCTRFFPVDRFYIAFSLLMLLVAFLLGLKKRPPTKRLRWDVHRSKIIDGKVVEYGYHRLSALGLALFVGFCSGLFGIGGGSLLVPIMVMLYGFPPHVATATSMFTIFLTSIFGSAAHVVQGNVDWFAVLCLAPGSWIGGHSGAWIASRLPSQKLLLILRISFMIVAIRMLLKGLHLI